MFALPKNKESYKETTVYLLSNGCMVQTNDDIEITEDIRLALATIVKKAHNDRVDRLVNGYLEVKQWQKKMLLKTKSKPILNQSVLTSSRLMVIDLAKSELLTL